MIRLFSLFALIFLLVGMSYAAPNKVKSKMGDLDLTRYKDGGEVMCTVGSREVMNIVKMGESSVLDEPIDSLYLQEKRILGVKVDLRWAI